jgi:hypothetical protein
MVNRAVNDPFEWDHELEQIERRMVARMTDFTARGYEATDYQRNYFQALKWSPTMGDRLHAIAAVERENEARKRAAFAASYVAPPVRYRPGHATEATE